MAYLGHKPAVGENNSFRILDDISSFILTFDGSSASAVGLSDETITITENNHRFITGQRVTYSNGGGGNITGLTNGQAYFVINHSSTQIKLASSASNALAGTAVNLTGLGTGSSHTLTLAFDGVNTKFVPTFGDGMHDTLIKRAAQLVISLNGVIQQPHDTATPSTGFGVDSLGNLIFSTAPASTDIFWAHVLATNTVTFDSSDNDVDTFTGNGSTTSFTLSKIPPDNRNILVTIDGVVQYPSDAANTRSYSVSENVMTFVAAPGLGTVIQVRHIGYAGPAAGGGGGVTGFYGRTGNVSLQSTDNIVANNATFNGNVSIAQTLTYEDVTEIDSVGMVTARSGIKDQTLTAGHVVFAGTAGRLSGEANLFYDSSNDRLGIGLNNPQTKLDVQTTTEGEVVRLRASNNTRYLKISSFDAGYHGSAYDFNATSTGGALSFSVTSDEKLRITKDGDVGIGTTNPLSKLHIVRPIDPDQPCLVFPELGNNPRYSTGLGTRHVIGVGQRLDFYAGDSGSNTSNLGSSARRMSLTAQGRLGIGTTNPNAQLDVYKSGTGTVVDVFMVRSTTGAFAVQCSNVAASNPVWALRTYSAEDLVLSPGGNANANEKVRIKASDGKVGIGSVIPGATLDLRSTDTEVLLRLHTLATKNAYLDIVSDANRRGIIRFQDTGGTTRWSIGNGDSDELTNTSFHISSGNSGGDAAKFVIDSNGDVGINETNPTQKLHVDGSIKLSAQLMQSMPADFWSQGNTFIEFNGIGNLTHMGSFETVLTSNGYRTNSSPPTWKSYAANSNTGAAQIRLNPAGYIVFATEATKSDGDTAWRVDERLRIESDGNIKAMTGTQYKGFQLVKADGGTVAQLVGHASDNDEGGLNLWDGGTKKVQILASGTSYLNGGNIGIGINDPDSILETVSSATNGINAHIGGLYNDGGQSAVRRVEFGVKNYRNVIQSQQGSGGDNFSSDNDLLLNPSGGNVGIHETSPAARLHISSPASTTCELRLTANNTGSGAGDRGRINVYSALNDGTAYQAGHVDIDRSSGTDDKAHLLVALNNGTSVGERLRITADGRVGMNQDTPLAGLHVGTESGNNVAFQVGTISGQNRYLTINHFNSQQNFYQVKMRCNDNQLIPMLDLGNPYGSTGHGTQIRFSGHNDTECGAIQLINTADNNASSVDMVFRTGGTDERLRITSTGILQTTCTQDSVFKFQIDDAIGWWNTNTGLAPNTTRTWTITNVNYGGIRILIGGGDGNYQRAGAVIEAVGTMWANNKSYYHNETIKNSSGASISTTYNNASIVISVASSSNWWYYSMSIESHRRESGAFPTVTVS